YLAQLFESPLRQGHVTVLVPFAPPDMQQHATAVNIAGMQQEALTESQAAGIDGRQASPVDRSAHATQNALDLLAAQDHGQFLFLGWTEQFQGGPASLEGGLEQEFDAAKGDGGG